MKNQFNTIDEAISTAKANTSASIVNDASDSVNLVCEGRNELNEILFYIYKSFDRNFNKIFRVSYVGSF